jgi:hypothetical protein
MCPRRCRKISSGTNASRKIIGRQRNFPSSADFEIGESNFDVEGATRPGKQKKTTVHFEKFKGWTRNATVETNLGGFLEKCGSRAYRSNIAGK